MRFKKTLDVDLKVRLITVIDRRLMQLFDGLLVIGMVVMTS